MSDWDFSNLSALFINCTLKPSPEMSHTQGLIDIASNVMSKNGVKTEVIRAIDYEIATGVWPDMTEHGAAEDAWPALYEKVQEANILVIGSALWLGEKTSVATRVVERLYGNSSLLNEQGQYAYYGKVGGCLITGNEDGAKHAAMNLLYSLQHLGYVIPPQADAAWLGEAGPWSFISGCRFGWTRERLHQPQHHVYGLEPHARCTTALRRGRHASLWQPARRLGRRRPVRFREP